MKDTDLTIFEDYNIRRQYDDKNEKWNFSVVDIIKVLKNRLAKEGSEVVTKCNRLKLLAEDGKMPE